jgi:hypothetical protein
MLEHRSNRGSTSYWLLYDLVVRRILSIERDEASDVGCVERINPCLNHLGRCLHLSLRVTLTALLLSGAARCWAPQQTTTPRRTQ